MTVSFENIWFFVNHYYILLNSNRCWLEFINISKFSEPLLSIINPRLTTDQLWIRSWYDVNDKFQQRNSVPLEDAQMINILFVGRNESVIQFLTGNFLLYLFGIYIEAFRNWPQIFDYKITELSTHISI